MTINSANAESPQNRVNYHLRKMQTTLENSDVNAKVNARKISNETRSQANEVDYERNHPLYGIEDNGAAPLMTFEQTTFDGPNEDPTAEEIIRNEAQSRKVSSQKSLSAEEERAEFIRQLKENARAKGIKLEVDPVTLEVRRVR